MEAFPPRFYLHSGAVSERWERLSPLVDICIEAELIQSGTGPVLYVRTLSQASLSVLWLRGDRRETKQRFSCVDLIPELPSQRSAEPMAFVRPWMHALHVHEVVKTEVRTCASA